MQHIVATIKKGRLLVVLILLITATMAHAQQLPAPNVLWVSYGDIVAQISLVWETQEDAAGYEVFIKGPGEWKSYRQGGKGGWQTSATGLQGYHVFSGLNPGDTYALRIRAIDGNGVVGQETKKCKRQSPPQWVWDRYLASGQKWVEEPNFNKSAC